jgi:hypothetical protein
MDKEYQEVIKERKNLEKNINKIFYQVQDYIEDELDNNKTEILEKKINNSNDNDKYTDNDKNNDNNIKNDKNNNENKIENYSNIEDLIKYINGSDNKKKRKKKKKKKEKQKRIN